MSFKDKLFASKDGKDTAKIAPEIDVSMQQDINKANHTFGVDADDIDQGLKEPSFSDIVTREQVALEEDAIQEGANQESNLFLNEQVGGSSPPVDKKPNKDKMKLKIYLALTLLLLVVLTAFAINLFLSDKKDVDVAQPSVMNAQNASPSSAEAADSQANMKKQASATNDSKTKDSEQTISTEKLKESIDRPMPENAALAAEELDALADEQVRLAEQEKLITQQIDTAKQLTQLKARKIALLEQKIKQAESLAAVSEQAEISTKAATESASRAAPTQAAEY